MAGIHQAGFQLVDHLAYWPNLASSDYRLLSKLKHLHEKKFSRENDVMSTVNKWFEKIGENFLCDAYEIAEHR